MKYILFLLVNTLCVYGMDDSEKTITPSIVIPPKSVAIPIPQVNKPANQPTKYIIISPTDHLFWLGNYSNSSPEKRSPGTSLR